jgi:hypothetical protein
MPAKPCVVLALLFRAIFSLGAELLFAPEILSSPERVGRLEDAVNVLARHAPDSPVPRWSYSGGDPRYNGDLWIGVKELDNSTLGQWNGAEVVLSAETLDSQSVQELALILHHEAAHADHHYRDLESVLINDYSAFFSPRQFLLFEMLNEALAVYKETSLRYKIGINNLSKNKYRSRPSLSRYDEDFYSFYKDLRRWMKGRAEYIELSSGAFEQALFREFVTGFFSDPWYLDYYMPQSAQRYVILRGRDFAVCPMVCFEGFSRFTGKEGTEAIINRYVRKNSPAGMDLGVSAAELEAALEKILDDFENDTIEGAGPGNAASLENLGAYRESQNNFETLPKKFRELPGGIELFYKSGFSSETVDAFHRLLDGLEVPRNPGAI